MKRLLVLSVLIFTVVFGLSAEGGNLPTIAVMDVAATNTSDVKSQVIYEYIVDVVNKAEMYTIVERSALQAAIDEMQIGSSGLVDDTTAAQIGKLAGAKFILISNLIVDDGITYLSTRIVSVESGQVTNTAMLQAGEGEYIASLASRTVSELLGVELVNKNDSGKKEETEVTVSEESSSQESVSDNPDNTDTGEAGTPEKKSGISVTVAGLGIIPLLDSSDIFDMGFGANLDLDFVVLSKDTGVLSFGVGSGYYMDSSSSDVLYPFDMLSIPMSLNLKYKMVMGNLFLTAKLGGGIIYSVFTYSDTPPVGIDSTWTSINAVIFPGISAGYMLTDKFGLALFSDWSMTFFPTHPYTAVNAGLAAVINL